MRVFSVCLLAAVAVVTVPQVASAQRPGGGQGQRPVNPVVAALDADSDGSISAKEIADAVAALKKLDKNGDGVLSGEEIRPAGFGGPGAGGPGAGGPGAGAFNPEEMIKRILEADKNGDGKLSKEEAPDRMKDRFDTLDTNKDGSLDKDELKAMASRFGGGRPGAGGRPEGGRPGARPEGAPRRPE